MPVLFFQTPSFMKNFNKVAFIILTPFEKCLIVIFRYNFSDMCVRTVKIISGRKSCTKRKMDLHLQSVFPDELRFDPGRYQILMRMTNSCDRYRHSINPEADLNLTCP